jgi:hypothetical protein
MDKCGGKRSNCRRYAADVKNGQFNATLAVVILKQYHFEIWSSHSGIVEDVMLHHLAGTDVSREVSAFVLRVNQPKETLFLDRLVLKMKELRPFKT